MAGELIPMVLFVVIGFDIFGSTMKLNLVSRVDVADPDKPILGVVVELS